MHCLTRCVLSWEPDRRREVIADLPGDAQQSFEIDAFAILSLARLPFRHLSNRFSTLDFRFAICDCEESDVKPHLPEVRRRVPPAPPVSFSLQPAQVLHRPRQRRLGRCCGNTRSTWRVDAC